MKNIAAGYHNSNKTNSSVGLTIYRLRQRCQSHQKIAMIHGIPSIVNKTRLDRMVERIFNK